SLRDFLEVNEHRDAQLRSQLVDLAHLGRIDGYRGLHLADTDGSCADRVSQHIQGVGARDVHAGEFQKSIRGSSFGCIVWSIEEHGSGYTASFYVRQVRTGLATVVKMQIQHRTTPRRGGLT